MKDNHQNSLAKAVRSTDRKSEQVNVAEFHPASLILQGLIDAGIPSPRLEGSLIMYSAITLKNSVLNKGDPVMYVNREDEVMVSYHSEWYTMDDNADNLFQWWGNKGAIYKSWYPTIYMRQYTCTNEKIESDYYAGKHFQM